MNSYTHVDPQELFAKYISMNKAALIERITELEELRAQTLETINSIPTPPHEETTDGMICKCWCMPKASYEAGDMTYSHNDLINREELKNKLGLLPVEDKSPNQ